MPWQLKWSQLGGFWPFVLTKFPFCWSFWLDKTTTTTNIFTTLHFKRACIFFHSFFFLVRLVQVITVEPPLFGPWLSRFLDYLDFFSGPNLVMNIYKSRSRSVAISFVKLQHWKVKSNARFFGFPRAKAVLACVVTNEEHSNEFWLAQSCIVAKWNFTLYYIYWLARCGMQNKQASITNVYLRSSCLWSASDPFFNER